MPIPYNTIFIISELLAGAAARTITYKKAIITAHLEIISTQPDTKIAKASPYINKGLS
jgi:hypothetical protein